MKLPTRLVLLSYIVISLWLNCHALLKKESVQCPKIKRSCKVEQKSSDEGSDRQIIYFGLMTSFPDPFGRKSFVSSFDDGHNLAPAAYLAVNQVNKRPDLLKNYEVRITRLDSGCDVAARTIIGVNELVCSCEPIVAIIGPSCEKSSRIVSQLTNREEFSMITVNYGGSDASVGNYNYSFGIVGINTYYDQAIAQILKDNNWNNSALLFSSLYSELHDTLTKRVHHLGYQFQYSSLIYCDAHPSCVYIPLDEVKNSFSRIIVILASPMTVLRALCIAYHKGMVYPRYQWIFLEGSVPAFHNITFTYEKQMFSCSHEEIRDSVDGSLTLFPDIFEGPGQVQRETDVGITLEQYYNAYVSQTDKYSRQFSVRSSPSPWAKPFYDSVWVLTLALNDSLDELNNSLTKFQTGSKILAESIRQNLLKTDFRGTTGYIAFDNRGSNTERLIIFYQFVNNELIKIASQQNGTIYYNSSVTANFIDASFKTVYIHIKNSLIIGLSLFTFMTLIFVIMAHIVNIYYRHHKAIKATSPAINHIIFFGYYTIILVVILNFLFYEEHIVQKAPLMRQGFCTLIPWLLCVGTSLFLSTICAKTWRLNRIYNLSKELKKDGMFIRGYHLVSFVFTFVIFDTFVCLLWFFIDRLELKQMEYLDIKSVEPFKTVNTYCHSNFFLYWCLILIIPKVIVIFTSFILAITTKINMIEFQTSNVIILTYLLTILFGCSIPIYAIMVAFKFDVLIRVVYFSVLLNGTVCIGVITLFLPLIVSLLKRI